MALVPRVIIWYHYVLGHSGDNRLDYQLNMQLGAGYGKLTPQHALLLLWSEVVVDLIGHWRLNVQGQEVELNTLASIDIVTNITKIIRIENKTAKHVAHQFENS
eukprot:12307150-Ditylum_brightwellii.AAC.1